MSLRPLLRHLEHHPDAPRLQEPGARAFVSQSPRPFLIAPVAGRHAPPPPAALCARAFFSQSLRPFLIAAFAARHARRPTVVVAGDDRAARDLAADLRA